GAVVADVGSLFRTRRRPSIATSNVRPIDDLSQPFDEHRTRLAQEVARVIHSWRGQVCAGRGPGAVTCGLEIKVATILSDCWDAEQPPMCGLDCSQPADDLTRRNMLALAAIGIIPALRSGEHGKIKTMLDKCPKAFKAGRGGGDARLRQGE